MGVSGDWLLANPVVADEEGASLDFRCARLRVRDDGRRWRTRYGKSIPLGFYIVANKVALLGDCRLEGLGTPGQTLLNGIYGDEVDDLSLGRFDLSNMALGLHMMCCRRVTAGDLRAIGMWGLQEENGEAFGAGSAQIVSGCSDSTFGHLVSLLNDKPARYLSIGRRGSGEPVDNVRNRFGHAFVTGRPGSPWAQVMGLRSSIDSTFGGGTGRNVSYLLNIEQYLADEPYHVDGNDFGDWSGGVTDAAGSSVDAAVSLRVDPGAKPLGRNRIGRIKGEMAPMRPGIVQRLGLRYPANFGLWANSGQWSIASLEVRGFRDSIYAYDCELDIGAVTALAPAAHAVMAGPGLDLSLDSLAIPEGVAGPRKSDAALAVFAEIPGEPEAKRPTRAAPRVTIGELSAPSELSGSTRLVADDAAKAFHIDRSLNGTASAD